MGLLQNTRPAPLRSDPEAVAIFRDALSADGAPDERAARGAFEIAMWFAQFERGTSLPARSRAEVKAQLEELAELHGKLDKALGNLSADAWAHLLLIMPPGFSQAALLAPPPPTVDDLKHLQFQVALLAPGVRCAAASYSTRRGPKGDDRAAYFFAQAALIWRICTPDWPALTRDSTGRKAGANHRSGMIDAELLRAIKKAAQRSPHKLLARLGDGLYKRGVQMAMEASPKMPAGVLLDATQVQQIRNVILPHAWMLQGRVNLFVNWDGDHVAKASGAPKVQNTQQPRRRGRSSKPPTAK